MAGVNKTLTTFSDYLNDRKWLFHERGLMFVWNELKRIANTATAGSPADYDFALVAEAVPDFTIAPGTVANTPASMGPYSGRVSAAGTAVDPPTQSI